MSEITKDYLTRKSTIERVGLIEIETSPDKDQRKEIGIAIASINSKAMEGVGKKIEELKLKPEAITKELLSKLNGEIQEELREENKVILRKCLIMLTNIPEEVLDDDTLNKPSKDLRKTVGIINEMLESYVLEYENSLGKNFKKVIKDMKAGQ